jgi:hypothetical protein
VTDTHPDDRQRDKTDHLRAQNRRYRELIQNLSSVVEILRHRLEGVQPKPRELRAFEKIDGETKPPVIARTRASGVASVLRRVLHRAAPDTASHLNPLIPNPGWKCLAIGQPQIRIGFTLFGMTPEAVEEAVGEVEHRQVRSRDFTPVFVTDSSDLGPFRGRGYVVEYIPESITSRSQRSREERQHLRARVEFFKSKWGLGKVVDLGPSHQ